MKVFYTILMVLFLSLHSPFIFGQGVGQIKDQVYPVSMLPEEQASTSENMVIFWLRVATAVFLICVLDVKSTPSFTYEKRKIAKQEQKELLPIKGN